MERFDFAKTSTLPGPVARALEADLESVVPRVGMLIESLLRRPAEAAIEPPGRTSLFALDADASWFRLELVEARAGRASSLGEPRHDGVAVLERAFVVSLAEMLMGGPGIGVDRAPTSLERALVASRISGVLQPLVEALGEQDIESFSLQPIDRDDLATDREMALVTVGVTVGEIEGSIKLGLPLSLFVSPNADAAATDFSPRLMAALSPVPFAVRIQFAPTKVSSTEIDHLTVGDVIRLDHPADQPLYGLLEGKCLFLARPGRRGRHLAVEVEAVAQEV